MEKALRRIEVKVREPFSGGWLRVYSKGVQLHSSVFLTPLRKPNYSGLPPSIVELMKVNHRPGGYTWLTEDICIPFEGELDFELQGRPKSSVKVKLHTQSEPGQPFDVIPVPEKRIKWRKRNENQI